MSLSSSMQIANNALRTNAIGLQVTGQNIANANTPGYIREELQVAPAPTQRTGEITLGLGVEVVGVIQKIDKFLQGRLQAAGSDLASSEVQEDAYAQLETIVGELSDTDLSTALNRFFTSIADILNQPESVTTRNLAVLEAKTLTGDIVRLNDRVRQLQIDANGQVASLAADVNRLIEEIRTLNLQISETEAADVSDSDAVGLRDKRGVALHELAKLIKIRVDESPSGTVNVFAGGDFLVYEATARFVLADTLETDGLNKAVIKLEATDAALEIGSGKIAGLIVAHDEVFGAYLESLDDFSQTLIFEFNKLYSSGQGLKGFKSLTGEFSVNDAAAPLDAAGLAFTPTNGSFQVQVFNRQTGLTQTTNVFIDLNGLNEDDTTLASLAAALNAVSGVSATVNPFGQLQIASTGADQEIAFANDSSGELAALGVNTFFSGSSSADIGVNKTVVDDPAKFAASRGGVGKDTAAAIDMAAFLDRPLESKNDTSLETLYDALVGDLTQQSSVAKSVTEGFRVFEAALNGQHLSVSGVSLDEEAVRLITYQRAFQANARLIAAVSDLLEILVNI